MKSAQQGRTAIKTAKKKGPYLNQAMFPGLFSPQQGAASVPSADGSPTGDMFGMLDRFGGIDGIMGTVGKFQKMMGMFQQFQQMFKLLGSFGSFGPLAGTKAVMHGNTMRPHRKRPRASGKRRSYKR
ncbi:hypothetical protein AB6A23_21340 [Paenibacillus tarimensis]